MYTHACCEFCYGHAADVLVKAGNNYSKGIYVNPMCWRRRFAWTSKISNSWICKMGTIQMKNTQGKMTNPYLASAFSHCAFHKLNLKPCWQLLKHFGVDFFPLTQCTQSYCNTSQRWLEYLLSTWILSWGVFWRAGWKVLQAADHCSPFILRTGSLSLQSLTADSVSMALTQAGQPGSCAFCSVTQENTFMSPSDWLDLWIWNQKYFQFYQEQL